MWRHAALLAVCCCTLAQTRAQRISLDIQDQGLREALTAFSQRQRIDVVFSERQVAGQRSTCAYQGADLGDALRCILSRTPLRAERVRRRQYVLADQAVTRRSGSPWAAERICVGCDLG